MTLANLYCTSDRTSSAIKIVVNNFVGVNPFGGDYVYSQLPSYRPVRLGVDLRSSEELHLELASFDCPFLFKWAAMSIIIEL